MAKKTDITLSVDGVPEEELARVWSALAVVAHGYVLDGFRVSLWADSESFDGDGFYSSIGSGEGDEEL